MSDRPAGDANVRAQAAAWFAKLHQREISADVLEAFRAWRKGAGHRDAYAEIESVWRKTGKVEGDGDIDAALTEALARPATKSRRAQGLVWPGLGAGLALVAATLAIGLIGSKDVLRTAVGEQKIVRLEDGSRVRLDTDTRLRVRFSDGARRIELVSGQAYFEVAADASRPFTVEAAGTVVRAVGTKFDVRRDGDAVRAILVEGVIEVISLATPSGKWRLSPGQQIATGQPNPAPVSVDVPKATSWTTGRIVFDGIPLAAAVAEVNRYSRDQVTLEDPTLSRVAVSGAFDSGDTKAFVAAVTSLHDLEARTLPSGDIRLVRPSSPRRS